MLLLKDMDWIFSYVPFVLLFFLWLKEQCWILRKRKKRQGFLGYKLIYADQKGNKREKDFAVSIGRQQISYGLPQ